jgi:hypothetical protein
MTRVHAINLLTREHLWFSVPREHWLANAKHHAALEWSVCWDSVAILNYRHL